MIDWEVILGIGLIVGSFFLVLLRWGKASVRERVVLVGVVVLVVGGFYVLLMPARSDPAKRDAEADQDPTDRALTHKDSNATISSSHHSMKKYITSQACRKCHEVEYESWHKTYHRTMTQVATPTTVVAEFDSVSLESRGRQYHLERRGDQFWVNMVSPEWETEMLLKGFDLGSVPNPPRVSRQIVLTTGSHNMQTYWVNGDDGLRQVPWFYHIEEAKWIPSEDSFLRPPEAAREFGIWNADCIKCHSTGSAPGFDLRSKFNSQVSELGIACEACHGPGDQHAQYYQLREAGGGGKDAAGLDPVMANPEELSKELSSQICGQCHSSSRPHNSRDWLVNGSRYRPGENFERHFRFVRFSDPAFQNDSYVQQAYWKDGANRTGGDEYLGLIESECYQHGNMSCLSCHSMHNSAPDDQLKPNLTGNQACLQCHEELSDRITSHTHHAPQSSGSSCYNCHMPHDAFALFKSIRSHLIDSPDASVSKRTGRPNACNLCHLDKSLDWTASKLVEWYGAPEVELDEDDRMIASSVQMMLRGDAAQRVIWAWHMGWKPAHEASGDQWQAAHLAQTLNDPYSAIRLVAYRSLKKLPGFQDFEYDFVGPPQEREQAVRRAMELLRMTPRTESPPPKVLVSDAGELDSASVERLRAARDNSPIEIPE